MRSRRQFSILAGFVLAALVAFSNILNCYFLSDDFAQIGKVLGGDFSVAWGQTHGGFFRPLFILSYVIDTKIWGARPFGFHLTNVVIHALNSFLIFLLSLELVSDLKLDARAKRAISIGAASLFLLHPSHTEAVTWISGRADLLATCFCLLSLLCYLNYKKAARALFFLLSGLSFTLALLAKESAICLPFLLLVIGLSRLESQAGETITHQIKVFVPFGFILLVFVLVRWFFIGSLVGGYGVGQHLNFSPGWLRDRLLEASVRSVLPTLPAEWSFFLFKPLQSGLFIVIALCSLALLAGAIAFRRKLYSPSDRKTQNRFLLTLAALFVVSLLPVINLRLSLYQTSGERFLYLPSVFSCLLISYLLAILIRNRKACFLVLICVLGLYSWRLYQTNRLWRAASFLSQKIRDDLATSASRDRLLILNAPDNLRGVPVFHNGLPEAVRYFQNQKSIEQVEIISFQNFQSATDEIEVRRLGDLITIKSANENDSFDRVSGSQCVEVLAQSSDKLELRTRLCTPSVDFFLFSSGRMIKLPDK